MSNIAEFADIPEYSVTGNLTLQDVSNLVTEIYTRNYKAVNGTAPPLNKADPIMLTLQSMTELYYMMMQVAEKRTRCALLKTATGAELDNMGLPFGVKRNGATYATVTVRFSLSAALKTVSRMINLRDARITDGLPRIVAEQPWAQVLSAVYGELQDRMFEYLDTGMTFSEVDTCDEGVLDQMAVYLKIEWYDSTADVETKRRIVRTAIEIQRYAGTVKAVREQASAVYPDSEVEEWFDYGGTPGFWRLNVNITEAAAQYHTIREMEDLLGYTKRLSAHLEQISYMVRHSIGVGVTVECMAYKVPECGIPYCGTYWKPAQLGYSTGAELDAAANTGVFLAFPKITGTIPEVATKGWSAGQELQTTPAVDGYSITPAETGSGVTGDLPVTSTKGYTANMPLYSETRVEAFTGSPGEAGDSTTGTKPSAATLGTSAAATAGGQVKVEAFKITPRVCGKTCL